MKIKKVPAEGLVLPIFWAEEGWDKPPSDTVKFIDLVLSIPEIGPLGLAVSCFVFGSIFLSIVLIRTWRKAKSKSDFQEKELEVIENDSLLKS